MNLLKAFGLGRYARLRSRTYRQPTVALRLTASSTSQVDVKLKVVFRLSDNNVVRARNHFGNIGHMRETADFIIQRAAREWASHRNCVSMCRKAKDTMQRLRGPIEADMRRYGIDVVSLELETHCLTGHPHCNTPD